MNDADYIESLALVHDRNEAWFRSQGMFEVAQYYQWAADRVRLRQPGPATRGCGGASLLLVIDEDDLYCSGDMTIEDIRDVASHLADRVNAHDEATIRSVYSDTRRLIGQMQSMVALWNAGRGPAPSTDEGPY